MTETHVPDRVGVDNQQEVDALSARLLTACPKCGGQVKLYNDGVVDCPRCMSWDDEMNVTQRGSAMIEQPEERAI